MKNNFLLIFVLLITLSCKKNDELNLLKWEKISERVQYQPYPDGFKLKTGKFTYNINSSDLPYKKVILLNASLVGYFTELGEENKIIGISSPEYIYSEKIHQLIKEGKIQNIGNEQKYDIEKIIALQPDVIFTNYIASFDNTYDLLRKNGIEIIFLDEYLEQNPLSKSKYLIVFGKLLGVQKESGAKFKEIENSYNSLKLIATKSTSQPTVLANEIYGNQWFLAGGKSNLAQFISDANANYINAENADSKSIPLSFEEVYTKSENAEYWINVGNHKSKKDLLQISPNYVKMKVYNSGKLYNVSGREKGSANDYFETGVVRADLVLKDYIKIFHPEIFPQDSLYFMKELK
ncbi:ABC transporter substrate-binding protein [Chryseobacterium sp. MP_3.2]|uniref:ABC transporter substrate-binding protein n=1 Tax=Chryseobacterium sp. MP_3.2 TaxID=3071712 RepID=UPI002DFA57D3|nr:iron complex transport system substrate-binding protein [Chryseobacterium sp. MP_3.2]